MIGVARSEGGWQRHILGLQPVGAQLVAAAGSVETDPDRTRAAVAEGRPKAFAQRMARRVRQDLAPLVVPPGGIVAVIARQDGAGETVQRGHSCRVATCVFKELLGAGRGWVVVAGLAHGGEGSTGTFREHDGGAVGACAAASPSACRGVSFTN